MVDLRVDVVLKGTICRQVPEDVANKIIDRLDGSFGIANVAELPFDVNWDDVAQSGEGIVDDIYIKVQ